MLTVLVGEKMRKAAKRINRFWRSHKKVKYTKDLAGREGKVRTYRFCGGHREVEPMKDPVRSGDF